MEIATTLEVSLSTVYRVRRVVLTQGIRHLFDKSASARRRGRHHESRGPPDRGQGGHAGGCFSPNPTLGPVTFHFSARKAGRVSVAIYDVAGRLVRTVVGRAAAPGLQSLSWDTRDSHGSAVPAGVYYLEMRSDRERSRGRLVILR